MSITALRFAANGAPNYGQDKSKQVKKLVNTQAKALEPQKTREEQVAEQTQISLKRAWIESVGRFRNMFNLK
jgi:hypothetical protein